MVNLDESTRSWRVGRRKKRDREKMDLPRGNLLNDYYKGFDDSIGSKFYVFKVFNDFCRNFVRRIFCFLLSSTISKIMRL